MKNHESALLVVLSYVIGFTTAFIMFVLANDTKNQMIDPAFESDLGMTQDRPASKRGWPVCEIERPRTHHQRFHE